MKTQLNLCEEKECEKSQDVWSGYCAEHHEYHYCECGKAMGEYAGEGFCKGCM